MMTATLAVLVGTYAGAGESLKLQMERQLSRDLNVCEKWYRARQEELQLTAVGLARHEELPRAIAAARLDPAAALLSEEVGRLQLDLAVLVDARAQLVGNGRRFDPHGVVTMALTRREQVVSTEAWSPDDVEALPGDQREAGLVRLVVTPILRDNKPVGALLLGDWVGERSAVPKQLTALIGGGLAIADARRFVAASGFPGGAPALAPAVWAGIRDGRYFYTETDLGGRTYLLAVRPLIDHEGATVGAFVRGFPESEITETLQRYAGSISLLTAAAVLFSLFLLAGLTRRMLMPLRQLAREVEVPAGAPVGNDELARLSHGVVQLAQQRGQLLEKIITAQEDERKRIARELHDQTGQALTGLLVGLKVLEGAPNQDEMRARAADLKTLALATLEEVHQLSVALRPAMLDDLGLVPALRALVKGFAAQHDITARCQAEALDQRLPGLWEVTLYRIAQEALTNVAKYADARQVDVELRVEGQVLLLAIHDDGRGFDPAEVAGDGRERLGLLGMQERVALIGGAFRLESQPGHGTQIEVRAHLPVKEAHPATS
jgi:signal transduction histidine kinase